MTAPKNPSAGSPPVSRRVAQATPGGPSLVAPVAREGGQTPHPVPAPGHPGGAQTPAGSAHAAADALPAGSSGAEWRKKVKAATSALHAAQRRGAHRYTKVADRTAGAQFRPGMSVRKPPEKPQGES